MKEFDVAAELKIYIDDPSKIEVVKKGVEKAAAVKEIKEEELGFGKKSFVPYYFFQIQKVAWINSNKKLEKYLM